MTFLAGGPAERETMDKIIWTVVSFLILIFLSSVVLRAQEADEEETCLTPTEIMQSDPSIKWLRPVLAGGYTNRAIAFFYTQVEDKKHTKYWTNALLADTKGGGGMLIVGDGPDSFCSWAKIPADNWWLVEQQLEGLRA